LRFKTQIFCLPFAGGGVLSYQKFVAAAGAMELEFIPLTTPGKDQRLAETLLTDMHQLADQYAQQLMDSKETGYILYGHSMGALMANLVVQKLSERKAHLPKHVVVSSYPAPKHHHDRGRGQMDDIAFIKHMKQLDGLPPRLLNEPSLMRVFLPILRADITAIDNYRYEASVKHDLPLTVLFGSKEVQLQRVILDWQQECTQRITVQRMEGGHFFIFEQLEKMMALFSELS
jgi:surfactin synthase thioesterase subunit